MGAKHLIYCPMFLRRAFHDAGREILRHILCRLGASRCTPPIARHQGLRSGLWVLSLSLLRGFAGLKKPLGYPCLVRESAPRPVFEGFSVRELWGEEG